MMMMMISLQLASSFTQLHFLILYSHKWNFCTSNGAKIKFGILKVEIDWQHELNL